jgi:hypothetical protein
MSDSFRRKFRGDVKQRPWQFLNEKEIGRTTLRVHCGLMFAPYNQRSKFSHFYNELLFINLLSAVISVTEYWPDMNLLAYHFAPF